MTEFRYPAYALSERIADGVMHGLGVTFAITGSVVLVAFAAQGASAGVLVAVSVYSAALVATFVASAIYHMTPWDVARPVLRRIDHAAIYIKIAGTYTPLVVLIGTGFAYGLLAVVWTLALAGALSRMFLPRDPGPLATALYLLLGWLGVLLIWPMIQSLPPVASWLALAGGLLYSAGVIFFRWESLRFSNAIWHGFVLAASACFFAAISLGVFSGA